MAWCRWAATVLCLAAVVAVQIQWPVPPVPEQLAFHGISADRFSQLRRQIRQFVEARPKQGFEFVEQRRGVALQIHCRGVPVLWLERRSHYLLLQVSLDARQRAPDVVRFRALLQWQMEPLGYLEQALAEVPEPVLMDLVRRVLTGEVPDGARCGAQ